MGKNVDYIIVGQGLAGTALSWQLIQQGASVMVIDQCLPQTSSLVAAGLYNPVTGHKMAKTWLADTLFPQILPFYRSIEEAIGTTLIHETGIYRPFLSIEEGNDWHGRAASPEYRDYIKNIHLHSLNIKGIVDPFGGIMLSHAGYVEVSQLILGYREWLRKRGIFIEEVFDENKITQISGNIEYEGICAKMVIYCQGVIGQSAYFNWLPFHPVKGELMDVKSDTDYSFILNRGAFMVPLGQNTFRLGATYKWKLEGGFEDLSEAELVEKIASVFDLPMKILEKKWGIRPATKDRRPFIGIHPLFPTIGIFNGLGSKGVSLAPYFALHFANCLKNGDLIDKGVDIKRYFSLN